MMFMDRLHENLVLLSLMYFFFFFFAFDKFSFLRIYLYRFILLPAYDFSMQRALQLGSGFPKWKKLLTV